MVLQTSPQIKEPIVTWEPLPNNFVLPDDPVENVQQPWLAAALTDALDATDRIQPQMLIASNFGLVANVNHKRVVKAPNWLYVPQINPTAAGVIRRSYTPHLEGAPVAVVMEFLSDTETGEYSVRPTFPYGKLYFYEQILKVPTYAIFDPSEVQLEVRRLEDDRYVLQNPTPEGCFWIPELELFLGIWYGTRLEQSLHWFRWWDESGNLLLWGTEKAEQERQRAEQERQRAEQERQRAEQINSDLEAERQRNTRLMEKLQELGIDPTTLQ